MLPPPPWGPGWGPAAPASHGLHLRGSRGHSWSWAEAWQLLQGAPGGAGTTDPQPRPHPTPPHPRP